jgi:hypothetical protein
LRFWSDASTRYELRDHVMYPNRPMVLLCARKDQRTPCTDRRLPSPPSLAPVISPARSPTLPLSFSLCDNPSGTTSTGWRPYRFSQRDRPHHLPCSRRAARDRSSQTVRWLHCSQASPRYGKKKRAISQPAKAMPMNMPQTPAQNNLSRRWLVMDGSGQSAGDGASKLQCRTCAGWLVAFLTPRTPARLQIVGRAGRRVL